MYNRITSELKEMPSVDLLYVNTKAKNNKTYIDYHVVCDIHSLVTNIEVCKKIIATLEVTKALITNDNVKFSYHLETSEDLEDKILNQRYKGLDTAEILYSRDFYFQSLNAQKNKSR